MLDFEFSCHDCSDPFDEISTRLDSKPAAEKPSPSKTKIDFMATMGNLDALMQSATAQLTPSSAMAEVVTEPEAVAAVEAEPEPEPEPEPEVAPVPSKTKIDFMATMGNLDALMQSATAQLTSAAAVAAVTELEEAAAEPAAAVEPEPEPEPEPEVAPSPSKTKIDFMATMGNLDALMQSATAQLTSAAAAAPE